MAKKKMVVAAPKAPKAAASEWTPENWVTLYSSKRGSISCPDHRPTEHLGTWRLDGWRKLTGEEVDALVQKLGHRPECETCAAVERRESAERATEAGTAPAADAIEAQIDEAGDPQRAQDTVCGPANLHARLQLVITRSRAEVERQRLVVRGNVERITHDAQQIAADLNARGPDAVSATWIAIHVKGLVDAQVKLADAREALRELEQLVAG